MRFFIIRLWTGPAKLVSKNRMLAKWPVLQISYQYIVETSLILKLFDDAEELHYCTPPQPQCRHFARSIRSRVY